LATLYDDARPDGRSWTSMRILTASSQIGETGHTRPQTPD
jgi:hypothetical protein